MKKVFQIWTMVFNAQSAPVYQPTATFETVQEAFKQANNKFEPFERFQSIKDRFDFLEKYPAAIWSRKPTESDWRWLCPAEAEGGYF